MSYKLSQDNEFDGLTQEGQHKGDYGNSSSQQYNNSSNNNQQCNNQSIYNSQQYSNNAKNSYQHNSDSINSDTSSKNHSKNNNSEESKDADTKAAIAVRKKIEALMQIKSTTIQVDVKMIMIRKLMERKLVITVMRIESEILG